jgi:hypothetical protein
MGKLNSTDCFCHSMLLHIDCKFFTKTRWKSLKDMRLHIVPVGHRFVTSSWYFIHHSFSGRTCSVVVTLTLTELKANDLDSKRKQTLAASPYNDFVFFGTQRENKLKFTRRAKPVSRLPGKGQPGACRRSRTITICPRPAPSLFRLDPESTVLLDLLSSPSSVSHSVVPLQLLWYRSY